MLRATAARSAARASAILASSRGNVMPNSANVSSATAAASSKRPDTWYSAVRSKVTCATSRRERAWSASCAYSSSARARLPHRYSLSASAAYRAKVDSNASCQADAGVSAAASV